MTPRITATDLYNTSLQNVKNAKRALRVARADFHRVLEETFEERMKERDPRIAPGARVRITQHAYKGQGWVKGGEGILDEVDTTDPRAPYSVLIDGEDIEKVGLTWVLDVEVLS